MWRIRATARSAGSTPIDSASSQRTINGSFSAPIWLVARSDSQRVYVLERQRHSCLHIDTTSTAGPDNVDRIPRISVPGAAIHALRRESESAVHSREAVSSTIVDVSQSAPRFLREARLRFRPLPLVRELRRIPARPPAPQTLTSLRSPPCRMAAALMSGLTTKIQSTTNYICPQVTVIDVASNTIKSSIAVPGFPALRCLLLHHPLPLDDGRRRRQLPRLPGQLRWRHGQHHRYHHRHLYPESTGASRMRAPGGQQNPPQNPVFLFAGP